MTERHHERDAAAPAPGTVRDHKPGEDVITLADEVLKVGTREVAGATVRVSTRTEAVEEIAHARTTTQDVDVTRVPVDRILDAPAEVRTEGDVVIVPVMEEVAVVETRLVLKEELHIRLEPRSETVEIPVTLRKQRAVVERLDPDDADEEPR